MKQNIKDKICKNNKNHYLKLIFIFKIQIRQILINLNNLYCWRLCEKKDLFSCNLFKYIFTSQKLGK